jgi:hypothetical protein
MLYWKSSTRVKHSVYLILFVLWCAFVPTRIKMLWWRWRNRHSVLVSSCWQIPKCQILSWTYWKSFLRGAKPRLMLMWSRNLLRSKNNGKIRAAIQKIFHKSSQTKKENLNQTMLVKSRNQRRKQSTKNLTRTKPSSRISTNKTKTTSKKVFQKTQSE